MKQSIKNILLVSSLVLLTLLCAPSTSLAQSAAENKKFTEENYETLLLEAQALLYGGRPIDARAMLLDALKVRPKDYRPHMYLAQYYLLEVGHFRLAYKYSQNAGFHFLEEFGPEAAIPNSKKQTYVLLLYLRSEAELNLDWYETSLATLEHIEGRYLLPSWFPGTKAWVLMKLKRLDEAIKTAQGGIWAGADPRRTWNILGILLSLKDQRELSLNAFAEAIKSELRNGGGRGFVATPLNNAGEVYREIFKDEFAEASWLKALSLPDGCEHILPSLNLAILYVDQLRLFQADRSLRNFEACFAAQGEKEDSEHKTLIALARGRIALHQNFPDKAMELFQIANQEQQWFGKIGTNQNDVEFASMMALAAAHRAQVAKLKDQATKNLHERISNLAKSYTHELKGWWLRRKIRQFAIEELEDFEDLHFRHTDTMLEYPTLGAAISGFGYTALKARLDRLKQSDSRAGAQVHYLLYLAEAALDDGKNAKAQLLLTQVMEGLRPIDRLAKAHALSLAIRLEHNSASLFSSGEKETRKLREELYALLPSKLRFEDMRLPVEVRLETTAALREFGEGMQGELLANRFEHVSKGARYQINIGVYPGDSNKAICSLRLSDSSSGQTLASEGRTISLEQSELAALVNAFIAKAFAHRRDPASNAASTIPFVEGIL